jgi:hypothetical protein
MFYDGLAGLALLMPLLFAQEPVKPPPDSPPASAADVAAAIGKLGKDTQPPSATSTKLEAPVEALARAWRRHGIKGAERESASQDIRLDRLRLPGIIHLVDKERYAEVEKALHRAWGEVLAVEEDRIYAWIPVPALRRIALMEAVHYINLDRPMRPDDAPKEKRQ